MENPNLVNPQLNGEPFFMEGGATGVLMLHGLDGHPRRGAQRGRTAACAGLYRGGAAAARARHSPSRFEPDEVDRLDERGGG